MFRIVEKQELAQDIFQLVIDAPRVARSAKPGQFVIVRSDEKGERIPLTISDYDVQNGTVSIVIQAIGVSTKKNMRTRPRRLPCGLRGPSGTAIGFRS